MSLLPLLFVSAPALADVSTPTDNSTTEVVDPCADLADGDACTTEDGDAGTCDAGDCVASEDGKGCSTVGAPALAGTLTLSSLLLLGLRRRR